MCVLGTDQDGSDHPSLENIQCVSLDSPGFVIYPEMKAAEVELSGINFILVKLLFQDSKTKLGESKETHCIS